MRKSLYNELGQE